MSKKAGEEGKRVYNHGLAFLALLSFLIAFSTARIFTSLFPTTIVQTGGIHFHHFWYGLAMVVVAGWIGISTTYKRNRPIIAVVFGIGCGLIGDELGLLLTLGNYHSFITYPVVVLMVVISSLAILTVQRGEHIKHDLREVSVGDWIILAGVGIAGLSAIAISQNQLVLGAPAIAVGIAVAIAGYATRKRNLDSSRRKVRM